MGARVGSAFLSKISFEDQSEAAQHSAAPSVESGSSHTLNRTIDQSIKRSDTNDEIPEIAESSRAKRDGRAANC
jgi:hypothetical protein